MTTPIYNFLIKNISSNCSRMYMPGHKGNHPYDVLKHISAYDITEITGADELYEAEGIIDQSEKNTAVLYETKHTSFSAGGSTLCIQAMLKLVLNEGDTVIAGRNVHTSFVNTCALLNINPYFVLPEFNDSFFVSGEISCEKIEKAILDCPNAKAVYITSPDYLGCISDVKAISDVCHRHNKLLIVDNAHGAHLKFLQRDIHPITLGADFCCDSAHKTFPVLTGGAYLHVNKNSNITKEEVKTAMSLFGSTSPSYLIMMSLDLNNKYLSEKAKTDFKDFEGKITQIYSLMSEKGFRKLSRKTDVTKLTFDAYSASMTGKELKEHFNNFDIEPEYTALRHVVLMLSPFNSNMDFMRLTDAIKAIEKKPTTDLVIEENVKINALPKRVVSVRKAMLGKTKSINIDCSEGEIAGQIKIKCPPGVPIVIPGEIIDKETQILLKKSSILTINVLE